MELFFLSFFESLSSDSLENGDVVPHLETSRMWNGNVSEEFDIGLSSKFIYILDKVLLCSSG